MRSIRLRVFAIALFAVGIHVSAANAAVITFNSLASWQSAVRDTIACCGSRPTPHSRYHRNNYATTPFKSVLRGSLADSHGLDAAMWEA